MKRWIVLVIVLVLVIGGIGAGYWYSSTYPAAWNELRGQVSDRSQAILSQLQQEMGMASENGALTASGFIEVDQVILSPQVSGQVILLSVDEGDTVEPGQVLVKLDRALLDAEIAEAEAAVASAEARLAQIEAGPRQVDVDQASAAVILAQAQASSASQAVEDARLTRYNQQDLDLEIASAETQLRLGQLALLRAVALKDAAALSDDFAQRWVDYVERSHHFSVIINGQKYGKTYTFDEGTKRQASANWNLLGTYLWQAWISIEQAQAQIDAAQRNLDRLQDLKANPLPLELAVTRAEATRDEAVAAVDVAQANVAVVEAGATQEQIALLESQLDQAIANLETQRVEQDKYVVQSPIQGQVIDKVVNQGEVVVEGSTLMTLGNLDTLKLTVYVPEPDVGQVNLGQVVDVVVDTYPDHPFEGKVVYIADEAEFTPKNVQTKEERANIVFGVKIEIPNPEHRLKPGMPADVFFGE